MPDMYDAGIQDDAELGNDITDNMDVNGQLRLTSGANKQMGQAVLVAGTVTVANTLVKAGSIIHLTRGVTGGTVGHLSVGTITADTSFVINSSSNTDTSTINWVILNPVDSDVSIAS